MMNHSPDHSPFARRRTPRRVASHIAMGIVFGTALVLVLGYTITLLWNTIMPGLFAVGHITFWHSIGLLFLGRILVGGFHGGGGHRRHRFGHRGDWHQYEDWWREAGEQSFREYAASHPPQQH